MISDGAQVSASTFGAGKGGNLTVNASESVQVIGRSADGKVGSFLEAQGSNSTGDAGDLSITTARLLISDGARVSASTFDAGKGGNLTVNASESVQVIGTSADGRFRSFLGAQADKNSTGDAGDLSITTARLLISDGAFLSTGTFGAGKGGNLTVNASESVQVIGTSADGRFRSFLATQAEQNSTGDAGELRITTPRLLISDGARVSASTFGAGKGGGLSVNASESVQVIGESADGEVGSALAARANPNSTGDAGELSITTPRLLISNGAQVSASTSGAGKGGNLTVNASESVQVIGRSANDEFGSSLAAQANRDSTGDAGELRITTPRLLISDGSQVAAGTFGAGKGGNLRVNASEEVQVIGTSADGRFRSGLFVNATVGSTAGNLSVETGQMSVRDGAQVTVSSATGQAGNMTITADSLTLNRGRLFAETGKSTAEGGANITLQGLNLLRMDNESLISATALEDANGGNVTIDSTFIVATPPTGQEGSDIIANAVRGNGGFVSITTQGLFGIEFRPQRTPLNDITVSSQFGLAGVFEQNTPDIDPSRGLAQLPTNLVNAEGLVDRACVPGGVARRNSFVVTGRGGMPPSPTEPLSSDTVWIGWETSDSEEENVANAEIDTNSTSTMPRQIVEAQGWVKTPDGQIVLVAQAPTVTPHTSWSTSPACQALHSSANEINATRND